MRPRHVRDHMNLLATVNRRVTEADRIRALATGAHGAVGTMSPYCHVVSMPATDEYRPEFGIYPKPGEDNSAPFKLPLLVHGIDTTFMSNVVAEAFRTKSHPRI